MTPKGHHYVPEFYLKQFIDVAGGNDSIWVYDKVTKDVRLQPIKDTAVVKQLYTFEIDGQKDTSLE